MSESSYNAPRLHVAMQARKIVISGEVAGLQIQLGTPAFPGRFDSCDLPPKVRPQLSKKVKKKSFFNKHFGLIIRDSPTESPWIQEKIGIGFLYIFFTYKHGTYSHTNQTS